MRKDAIVAAAGIAGGQGIVILSTPYLARLYSAQEFGVYAAVVAVATVVATVSSLRFDVAIPAVADHDVLPLFRAALVLPAFVCILIFGLFRIFPPEIVAAFGVAPTLTGVVAAVAFIQGSVAACQSLLVRRGLFVQGAILRVMQPLGFVVVAGFSLSSLPSALLAGWILVLIIALSLIRTQLLPFNCATAVAAAKRAWRYPVLSAPMALLDTLSLALPVLFIVEAYGSQAAGNYSQVQRLVAAPLLLLGAATSQVFFKHAGDMYRRGAGLQPIMYRVVSALASMGVILLSLVWMFGEPLMKLLLGEGWRTDTMFLVLVLAPVVVRMAVSPISSIFLICNRLGLGVAWQLGYFIVTAGLLAYSYNRLDFDSFLVAFLVCELLSYSCYLMLAAIVARVIVRNTESAGNG